MTGPVTIYLPAEWLDAAKQHAERVVASYAAGRKEQSRALAVPGLKTDAASNVHVQEVGRLCEIAVAFWLSVPPDQLNWSDNIDEGYDLVVNGVTIDVKGSDHPRASRLIHPATKTLPRADALVACRVTDDEAVEIYGWTSGRHFRSECKRAGPGEIFVPGTYYMNGEDLMPPDMFPAWLVRNEDPNPLHAWVDDFIVGT